MRDFMLHLRPDGGGAADSLPALGRRIAVSASRDCPQLEWHGELDFGTDGHHICLFAAPDYESAMRVERVAQQVKGLRVEVMPLRPGSRS